MRRRVLLLLLLTAAALGCARETWVREGSGRAELEADRQACLEASGNDTGVMNLRTKLFIEQCLRERGWRVAEPGEERARAVAPASPVVPAPRAEGSAEPERLAPADPRDDFDACFSRCIELTERSREQCFDACLAVPAR